MRVCSSMVCRVPRGRRETQVFLENTGERETLVARETGDMMAGRERGGQMGRQGR